MTAAKRKLRGSKAYRLVPKTRHLKAWKSMGFDGFELEVTGVGEKKKIRIVNCIPQGGCRPPFSKRGCLGVQRFTRRRGRNSVRPAPRIRQSASAS